MSTKCTIAYTKYFHLYKECFDENSVYLEKDVDASSIIVEIPIYIWEYFRKFPICSFDLIEKSDEELNIIATKDKNRFGSSPLFKSKDFHEDLKQERERQKWIKKKILGLESGTELEDKLKIEDETASLKRKVNELELENFNLRIELSLKNGIDINYKGNEL